MHSREHRNVGSRAESAVVTSCVMSCVASCGRRVRQGQGGIHTCRFPFRKPAALSGDWCSRNSLFDGLHTTAALGRKAEFVEQTLSGKPKIGDEITESEVENSVGSSVDERHIVGAPQPRLTPVR